MNFQIKHRHIECAPELLEKLSAKTARFARVVPDTAYVELSLEQLAKARRGGDKVAEVIVDMPGKSVIRFVAEGETFLEATDRVLDKLDGELARQKHRDNDYHYTGPSPKERIATTLQADGFES